MSFVERGLPWGFRRCIATSVSSCLSESGLTHPPRLASAGGKGLANFGIWLAIRCGYSNGCAGRNSGKEFRLLKVAGEVNPADLFTKHFPSKDRVH